MLIVEKLQHESTLTQNEQVIGEYILSLGRDISSVSTRVLASAVYTSPAAVIRFCKKLGFEGFDEFKEQFIRELTYLDTQFGQVHANFPFESSDTPMKAAHKIAALYEETIRDTMGMLSYKELKKACFLMRNHSEIHIFSYGTHLNTAESFREKMLKIGKPVFITNNLNYQLYQAQCLRPGILPILISYSGETEKILTIARILQKQNLPYIAITSMGENSLSANACCTLTISTKESLFDNLGDFSTHISVALILDILYSSFFLEDYETHYQRRLSSAQQYENHRHSENAILNGKDPL